MKKRILSIMLSLLLVFSTVPAGVLAQEDSPADYGTPGVDYAEGEAIVYVDGGAAALNNTKSRSASAYETEELMTVETAAELAAENSPMLRSAAAQTGKSLVLVKSGQDTESLIADLQNNPNVEFAEPNYYVEVYGVNEPTDPGYKDQWALKNQLNNNDEQASNPAVDINAVKAWESTVTTGNTPVVAVLDSGVDYHHPDLENIMWKDGLNYKSLTDMGGGEYGYNAILSEDRDNPMDTDTGHGTHCAGIIAAEWNNSKGVAGVSPNAQIMAVRFLGQSGSDIAGAIRGYAYIQSAAKAGVNVVAINNSWGPSAVEGRQLRSVSTAATAIGKDYGVVSCFAAGNSNTNNDLNSGGIVNSPYVVTVGAMDSEGYRSFFSCYGKETVDVFAPGSQILSTTTTFTDAAHPMNTHVMPVQYLPQIQEDVDSYFYENFENTSKVDLRLLDAEGKVVETTKSSVLSPGYASDKGLQISLDSIQNDEAFAIEMVFNRNELANIDTNALFNIAFQAGCDNAMYGQTFLLQYQDKDGKWQGIDSTQVLTKDPVSYLPAHLRLSDHNWNQSTHEVSLPDFGKYVNEKAKDEVALRLIPAQEVMSGKTGDTATFRLDDVGFGKKASDYFYSDGTSMATPVVTGIAALLSTKFDSAEEVCARIKGGVNRDEAQDLKDMSVSDGFVDAGDAFADEQCVPVLNDLTIDGDTATLKGYFFGTQGTVSVGGQNAAIKSWDANTIVFTLPDGVKGKQEVVVTPESKAYGRDFFSITPDTVNYQTLPAPNLDYGVSNGYPLTSADLYPLAAAATDNTLIYSGLVLETNQIKLAAYDFEKKVWSDVPLPENTFVSLMAAGKTKFYMQCVVMNAEDPQNVTSTQMLATYDPAAKKWSQVETVLPTGASLVVYQDKLLAVGGDDSDGNATKSVRIIDPATGKTTGTLAELPEGRSSAMVSASGNTLVVQGGRNGTAKTGDDAITYTNTMTFDGKNWTTHTDKFLTKDNPEFDKDQTLTYALTAVNGGAMAVGPVQNLGENNMLDTWDFNAQNGTWAGDADKLYSQTKTTQNIGAASGNQFYVLGYTGRSTEPLVFRSTTVDYTGPTGDPSGDQPTPPGPSPSVNPSPTAAPADSGTTGNGSNAGTGLFGGASGIALTAAALLLLAAGGLVLYRRRKG